MVWGRHVAGRGEQRGTVVVEAALGAAPPWKAAGQQLCLLQVVPWWAQLWLHTLGITYDGQVMTATSPANQL